MSEKDVIVEPLDDEDLEDVAGGLFDKNCSGGCADGGGGAATAELQ